ncbi:MAG: cyanophycinase [Rhodothermaceae bacterium]|nr:cyanophycinase [Rhodothermaceae bacterium]
MKTSTRYPINCLHGTCLFLFILFFTGVPTHAQDIGPKQGTLLLGGGNLQDTAIFKRFIEHAGGPDAQIVVIPTAGGQTTYDQYWQGLNVLRRAGAQNVTVLHTIDPDEANQPAFYEVIDNADGVWFSGGRQWRLADSYLNTETHKALWRLLDRGGIIGGSSAGATIQGSYLARGDTKTNTIMMGDHEEGLAFLKDTAVDQHLLQRNRQFDLIEIIEAHPELLGIGLDENTAIVVIGDQFQVIGQSYVAIYDHNRMLDSGGLFYLLRPGDLFNLKTREASRPTRSSQPFDRVQEKAWDGR